MITKYIALSLFIAAVLMAVSAAAIQLIALFVAPWIIIPLWASTFAAQVWLRWNPSWIRSTVSCALSVLSFVVALIVVF